MPIKKIFVPVQSAESVQTGLRAAIGLARRHKANIEALHIRQRPNIPAAGYYPVGIVFVDEHIAELTEALDAEAKKLKAIFDAVMTGEKIPIVPAGAHRDDAGATASWRDQQGILPFDISAAARIADITVFGRGNADGGFEEVSLIEEAIFQSGRPVLVAQPGGVERTPRRIAVGWNGGREAARALSAGMSVFAEADAVAVITIGATEGGAEGPERAAELLRLHGVKAEAIRRQPGEGQSNEDEFFTALRDWRADLVVMGAYSHSRWRELVLGGFTRRMLKQAEWPLLLAH
jgi:nucleotide-binding universal stress UspA family protein